MSSKRTRRYKWPDGVLGIPRAVIRSEAYLDMSLAARELMLHLQDVWKDYEPVIHYSVRQAAKVLGVSVGTATGAFKTLEAHGFIRMVEEGDWMSGQAREWRLTWMSSNGREPTNEWKGWGKLNPECLRLNALGPDRSASDTLLKKTPKSPESATKNQQLRVVSNA